MKLLALLCLLTISACGQTKSEPIPPGELSKPIAFPAGSSLTIRYIANEGVLIATSNKQILLDGLHRQYRPAYLFPPPEVQSVLENARPPYDKIDIVLVSHIHLDHFHPEAIGQYLKSNPRSIFASSNQAVDEVRKGFGEYEKIRSQIRPITHEWKRSFDLEKEGVRVKFLGLRHSSERFKEIQNLGHVIDIAGKRLLHIGDADMTVENFAAFKLAESKIDIAFIPYWYLTSADGRKFVREQFNPKHIIAVHISPGEANAVSEQLKKDLPEAIAFTKILEERTY